jgi:chromate transporter
VEAPELDAAARGDGDRPSLGTVLREWGRLGCIGFGGPPAHMALLRELCVQRRRWLTHEELQDAIAACNLLPGPASTQLAIFCAWRVRGAAGALVGGLAFIVPGLLAILGLSALFLAGSPPAWVRGAGAAAGAAVAPVAVRTGLVLLAATRERIARAELSAEGGGSSPEGTKSRVRFWAYLLAGGVAAATVGPWLVIALIACGALEIAWRRRGIGHPSLAPIPPLAAAAPAAGGLLALAWVALKVGALSYGGGFVIVPLMQHDAVSHYHWMTAGQFLNAVALGQVTPGPLVQTTAVVGYAAAGLGGGLLAATVAFAPSFLFVLGGARHFDRLRTSPDVQGFLGGAGPAAIGAILGSALPLALALSEPWQAAVLAGAAIALLAARRGIVSTLLGAGAIGAVLGLAGAPLPH